MIKLENVRKVYADGTEAVKDVSLEINEGEFCIFLGPSGCGKTTSLKMINRLIPLSSGKIVVNGMDTMKQNPNELRRGIGYAIQNIGLFPHLTVQDNIATVPQLRKWPKAKQRARAEELLDLIGMDPATFIDRYPSELSGGQQQRIGVARCLGADPPILLMDEPFGAIDPITRTKLQEEFLKIQAKIKKTIAFVTHDIHEAIKMGDRVALMKDGDLIQYTDPTTLLQQPANKFVRDFVGADRALKSLQLSRAGDVMVAPPLAISVGEDPLQARARMEREHFTWCILTDEDNRFLGWITHEDIDPSRSLRDIVKPPTVTAVPETPLNDALSMMLSSAIGTLSVLGEGERLLGVLSFDIVRDVLANEEDGTRGGKTHE